MQPIDKATMIEMLGSQMARLCEAGNTDVQRLAKECQRTPEDPEVWFELGLAYNQSGLTYLDLAAEKARFEYDEEPEPGKEGEEVHIVIDGAPARAMFQQALDALDKVLELEPEYYGLQTQRGVICGNMNDSEGAIKCFLQALKDDDEDFSAAYYLACAYRDMGDEEQAQKYFALSHELNPDDEAFCTCQGQGIEKA